MEQPCGRKTSMIKTESWWDDMANYLPELQPAFT
jgi:sensor domain CHASE-containing protein